jgi:catechol 2,3-dioxygenase-like lactoylglutathione lyase family enzyme
MARIRHLAIVTKDVDRLVKFYTNAFGLKVVEGVGNATYLTDGHVNLALIPARPERMQEGGHPGEGLNHFGIEVDDVGALAPVLAEWGATSDVEKRPVYREAEFRVKDPDGNPIDLSRHGWPH